MAFPHISGGGGGNTGTPSDPMVVDWYGFPGLSSENTPLQVMPMYNTGQNLPNVQVEGGDAWTGLPAQAVTELVIVNNSGVDIEFMQADSAGTMPILNGKEARILGIANSSQISLRRIDQAAEAVTVHARWHLA